jgi:hypothetical protein
MREDKHTPTPIRQYVQEWINSHEPDTFIKNEHGQYIYTAKHSSLNLAVFFEEILEEYTATLRAEKAELIEALSRVRTYLVDNNDLLAPFPNRSEIDNIQQTLAKYETK